MLQIAQIPCISITSWNIICAVIVSDIVKCALLNLRHIPVVQVYTAKDKSHLHARCD